MFYAFDLANPPDDVTLAEVVVVGNAMGEVAVVGTEQFGQVWAVSSDRGFFVLEAA